MHGACHIGNPFFVCEYASGGDLTSYLHRNNREPYLIWYTLLNAALGLQYLHDKGIVHADLKANNILIGADNIAKLTDFGLSMSRRKGGVNEADGGAVGAFRWKAPECIPWNGEPGKAATFASDVYSFAMVMIETATGTYPWGSMMKEEAVVLQAKKGVLPLRPYEIFDSEWRLIERMCCLDPSERVTIDVVVMHLSSLLERLDLARLRSPIDGGLVPIKHKNRVLSRGGAMLNLIGLANTRNTRLSWYATEHLVAVQVNRETHSEKREIDAMVRLLENGSDREKTWAGRAFMKLSSSNLGNEDELLLITACGGIPPLVALIRAGNDIQREDAAGTLWNLSVNEDNQVAIASCGGIPLLVALVGDGNDVQKENAVAALNNLAVNDFNKALIASSGAIPLLISLMSSDIDAHRVKAAGALGNLSGDAENSLLISECGGIPLLVALASDGNDVQKEKAASALANLSINHNICEVIATCDGIPPLVALVRDGNDIQKEKAVSALWGLSTNDWNKVLIAAYNGISPLVALVRDGNSVQKAKAAATLSNLAVNADNKELITSCGGVSPLVALLSNGNDDQKAKAAAALANLAWDNAANKTLIASAGAIPALVELVREGNDAQKENATAALRNVTVNKDNKALVVATGIVDALVELAEHGTPTQRENADGVLWNLVY